MFKVEVIADNSGVWCGNGRTFASQQAAEEYAKDLMWRWTAVREWRVVPCEPGGSKVKRKLTCTTPYGVVSRTTARTYTHVVVVRLTDGSIHGLAWCGSQRLAHEQFKTWANIRRLRYRFAEELLESWEVSVFPVDRADSLMDEWRHLLAKDNGHGAIPGKQVAETIFCARCGGPLVKVFGGVK